MFWVVVMGFPEFAPLILKFDVGQFSLLANSREMKF